MTRLSCPSCRLRFATPATATLTTCPECGRTLEAVRFAEATLGFRVFADPDPQPAMPMAVEAAVPTDVRRPDPA
jgi:hypothetical protein